MPLKTIAAEGKSAAQERGAGKASNNRDCSINFNPILLCDTTGEIC